MAEKSEKFVKQVAEVCPWKKDQSTMEFVDMLVDQWYIKSHRSESPYR